MRKLSILFILPISVVILSGCSSDENKHIPIEVTNLKSAVQYISEEKNYTLSYQGDKFQHDFLYTENAIGVRSKEYPQIDDFFIECNEGVFRLRNNKNNYVGGEILSKGNKLWGNDNYQKTMFNVSIDFIKAIEDNVNELIVSDKAYKIAYAYSIGYSLEEIPNIDSLKLSYADQKLTFDLTYLGNSIVYVAHDFNKTKNDIVDNYLSNGGTYLTVDSNLSKIRNLVKGNNFAQGIYYFGEDESGYIATAYFHEHYYATQYYGSNAYTGVISLNSKQYELKGIYYFTIIDGQMTINPNALYDVPSVPEYYHYPSYLALFENYEFLEDWNEQDMGSFVEEGYGYYLDNTQLLNDFAHNFSIDANFAGQKPVALAIDLVEDSGDTLIYFYYKFTYQYKTYVMPIPLYNFGNIGNSTLVQIYEMYND